MERCLTKHSQVVISVFESYDYCERSAFRLEKLSNGVAIIGAFCTVPFVISNSKAVRTLSRSMSASIVSFLSKMCKASKPNKIKEC